jgi:hypothetical protein
MTRMGMVFSGLSVKSVVTEWLNPNLQGGLVCGAGKKGRIILHLQKFARLDLPDGHSPPESGAEDTRSPDASRLSSYGSSSNPGTRHCFSLLGKRNCFGLSLVPSSPPGPHRSLRPPDRRAGWKKLFASPGNHLHAESRNRDANLYAKLPLFHVSFCGKNLRFPRRLDVVSWRGVRRRCG